MHKFLFWIQGAGEFSLSRPLIEYVKEQGHEVVLCLDVNTAHPNRGIVTEQEVKDFNIVMYEITEASVMNTLDTVFKTFKPEAFIMQPSRAWQTNLKNFGAKYNATIEANLQFMGVGLSYRLGGILPKWLDHYFVASDKTWYEETFKLHYGDVDKPKELKEKIKALGWLGKEYKRDAQDYVFVYTGSGMTSNEGYLQKIVDALPNEKIVAVSTDIVVGNYKNLTLLPSVPNFDELLVNSKYAIFHEAHGSVSKALLNGVPFVSIRGKHKLKLLETEATNILKYGKVINSDEITTENLQPLKTTPKVQNGVIEVYNTIIANL